MINDNLVVRKTEANLYTYSIKIVIKFESSGKDNEQNAYFS